jgi:DNA polymerase-3 subunit beta
VKFSIDKQELSSLTSLVHRAASHVASRNNIPTLAGILVEADQEKGLTMTATDLEIGIVAATKSVEVITPGKILVNANVFADFIKLLPYTEILLELDSAKNKLKVSYGRSNSHINLYAVEDYPHIPVNQAQQTIKIPQSALKTALKKTYFAAAHQHFRQIFTGVLFDLVSAQQLNIVASDTHRLAYYKLALAEGAAPEDKLNFIVPLRAIQELLRVLDDSDEEISIGVSLNNVIFFNDKLLLFSRIIDGQYPNYDNVVPQELTTDCSLNTERFVSALERAKTMPPDDKFKIPTIRLNFTNEEVIINTVSEQMGEIEEILEDITVEGQRDFAISFNTGYFLDIAKLIAAENETIHLRFSGPFGALIADNPQKEDYLYVLVPLRSNG